MRLPLINRNEDKEAKALAKAIADAMRPIQKEIEQTVEAVKKQSGMDKDVLKSHSLSFAIGKLTEEIRNLKEKDPDEKDKMTMPLVHAMKEAIGELNKEQTQWMREMLADDKKQTKLTQDLIDTVDENLNKDMKELVALGVITRMEARRASNEILKIERERDRRDARSRSEGRVRQGRPADDGDDRGLLKKLFDFLSPSSRVGFIGAITEGLAKLAFGVGAVGLLSLLPKEVKEFIKDFTNTFTMIRGMLKNTWLGPILKIFESVPLLGAILKKVPYLNALLAAFEILPKVVERFKKEGGWAALEEGLQGIYKFFVGDFLELIGGWMDKIKVGILGEDLAKKLDFTGFAQTLNVAMSNIITDVTAMLKEIGKILLTGVDDGTLDKLALDLFWDIVDGVIVSLRALFKYDPEETFSAREWFETWWKETWGKVTTFFNNLSRWIQLDFTTEEKVAIFNAFKWLVYDKPLEMLKDIGNQISEYLKGLGGRIIQNVKDQFNALKGMAFDVKDMFVEIVHTVWDAAKNAIMNAINSAIQAGIDLKDEITLWMKGMWAAVSDWIWNNTAAKLPGVSERHTADQYIPKQPKFVLTEQKLKLNASQSDVDSMINSISPVIVNNTRGGENNVNFHVNGNRRITNKNPLDASMMGPR